MLKKRNRKLVIKHNYKKKRIWLLLSKPIKKLSKIFFPVLIIAVPFLLYKLITFMIPVNTVICQNQTGSCSSYLQEKLAVKKTSSLGTTGSRIKSILRKDSLVKEYFVQYQIPSTISVNVIERKPKFALSNPSQSWLALTDLDGTVLALSETANFPTLVTEEPIPNAGEKVTEKVLFGLQIISAVGRYASYKKAEISDSRLVIDLTSTIRVVFPLNGDRELLLGSFFLTYAQLNSTPVAPTMNSSVMDEMHEMCNRSCEIDLRYKNPVIRPQVL